MADLETQINLDADEGQAQEYLERHGGALLRDSDDPSVYWASLVPRSGPAERYVARLAWSAYPHRAPSVLFATDIGGALGVASAWPQMPGYRPPSDICQPFTAEGFALHADWTNGPEAWSPDGNPLLRVVAQLQNDLDFRYQGRAA